MITIENVINEVSKNLNLNKELVSNVCRHPFIETVELMKNDDTRDILFNQLFKFKLKRRYKEDKNKTYSSK